MPPMHLIERFSNGVWLVVQCLGGGRERAGGWREPETTFRDGLGQYCWLAPSGMIFCSDPSGDKRHHGVVEDAETLRWLGFTQTGLPDDDNPPNEDGAT